MKKKKMKKVKPLSKSKSSKSVTTSIPIDEDCVPALAFLEENFGRTPFGEMLRAWRVTEELTQAELAEKSRVSKPAISRFESGKDFPTADTLRAITKALGADFDVFSVYIVQDMANKKGFNVNVTMKKVS